MKKLVIIFLGVGVLVLAGCASSQQNRNEDLVKEESNVQQEISSEVEVNSDQLTPEEVLARMNAEEGVGLEQGEVSVEIVSPEEKRFMQSQARMYEAQIKGLVTGSRCSCQWKFYLNQYDEEELYEEMETPCTSDTCGFTSTFIRNRGDLRVHVDVEVKDRQKETVQTAETERMYRVE